jgi:hypothetical protein
MSNRFDNKKLIYLLAGLIIILFLTVIVKIPKEEATLKSKIVELDTSEVNKILLNPKISKGKTVEFTRSNEKWMVQQGSIISATQEGAVQNIFNDIINLKPKSLAAVNKSKWNEFELTDSLATRIKFLDKKGKTLADLLIGKFNYRQADNPYGGYGGNNVQITSFVRVYNEKEVYAVDGLLPFSFNMKFEEWRNKTFIRSNSNDITGIHFTFPFDSSYSLVKKDSVWYIGPLKADSLSSANYLVSLKSLDGKEFKDNYKPAVNPDYQIQVEGNNLLSFSVRCYKGEGIDEYILNSTLNPDIYFTSKRNGMFEKIFKPQSHFLTQEKKK